MSEVKRYTFKGAAGEYVYLKDFDRVTAERDAALASIDSADASAQTLHEVISRLRSERDALRETLENSYTVEDHERVVAKGQELNVKYIGKLEQRLNAADERADVLEGLLLEVEAACDLAMSAIDDDERGANFVQIIAAIKAKAALKPAESAKCERCGCSTVETCDDLNCGYLGAGNGAPE